MENVKEQTRYDVVYQFKLRRESLSSDEMTETQKKDTFRVAVFDEVTQYGLPGCNTKPAATESH